MPDPKRLLVYIMADNQRFHFSTLANDGSMPASGTRGIYEMDCRFVPINLYTRH